MSSEFSKAEMNLIRACSQTWYDLICNGHVVDAPTLYDMLALNAFVRNDMGPHVDALRRVVFALHNCTVYRHTEEFDKLCKF